MRGYVKITPFLFVYIKNYPYFCSRKIKTNNTMSKIQDCAEKIYDIIASSSYEYRYRTESTLKEVFDTMLIFIDYRDLVEIVKERVYPKVCKLVHSPNDTHWVIYLERKIKEWESFYS